MIMPRSRFQLISSNISFDNRDLRQYIPAEKTSIKSPRYYNRFKNNIGEAVRPGEFLTIGTPRPLFLPRYSTFLFPIRAVKFMF